MIENKQVSGEKLWKMNDCNNEEKFKDKTCDQILKKTIRKQKKGIHDRCI